MAAPVATTSHTVPGLLRLPNELLFDIADDFSNLDLRRLGRVCRQLRLRLQYHLEISSLLESQNNRSSQACVSQKLHPTVTLAIARHDIRNNGSSLLSYAAKENLTGMASAILRLGGDVDTLSGAEIGSEGHRHTPLATATFHGYNEMAQFLLSAGASQTIEGARLPLLLAMANGYEEVALSLCKDDESGDYNTSMERTMLDLACDVRMVRLVNFFLEKPPRCYEEASVFYEHRNRYFSLHDLLITSCDQTLDKKELHSVFQIALALLHHGADPDMELPDEDKLVSARTLATDHPDPRIRLMFERAPVAYEHKVKNLLRHINQDTPGFGVIGPLPLVKYSSSASDEDFATLGEFMDNEYAANTTLREPDLQQENHSGQGHGYRVEPAEPTEPPSLLSGAFPSLASPSLSVQSNTTTTWGEKPADIVVAYSGAATSNKMRQRGAKQKRQEPVKEKTTSPGAGKIKRSQTSEEEIYEGMFGSKDIRASDKRWSQEPDSGYERMYSAW